MEPRIYLDYRQLIRYNRSVLLIIVQGDAMVSLVSVLGAYLAPLGAKIVLWVGTAGALGGYLAFITHVGKRCLQKVANFGRKHGLQKSRQLYR